MDDITFRALNTLKKVDAVFSEDTRVTGMLLNHFNIKKKLISLHEHNEDIKKKVVLEYLNDNKSVALVTDRGTPIISDPGYKSVKYVIENGYNVVALPGACAFIPALIVSGLSPNNFLFYGFLNSKKSKRESELEKLKKLEYTIIIYEACHRIVDTINSIVKVLGNRNICVAREISKKFESIYRGCAADIILEDDNLKGEFVIVIDGYKNEDDSIDIIKQVDNYIKDGLETMEAIKKVAKEQKVAKTEIYKQYHRRND